MTRSAGQLARNGLWSNNAALVQLLGLCPLLAVSSSVVNALGLGLVTLAVLTASNTLVSLMRHRISDTVRLPAFVLIIAALVTCAELILQAWAFALYQVLGIFIPLIVTNCAILGRADAFARKNSLPAAFLDGLMTGLGFALVLVVLGAVRELLGQGTLFHNMHLLFGETARNWVWQPWPEYPRFLLAALPPGAFIIIGCLIAAKNVIDSRQHRRQNHPVTVGTKRVRVTGREAS